MNYQKGYFRVTITVNNNVNMKEISSIQYKRNSDNGLTA